MKLLRILQEAAAGSIGVLEAERMIRDRVNEKVIGPDDKPDKRIRKATYVFSRATELKNSLRQQMRQRTEYL